MSTFARLRRSVGYQWSATPLETARFRKIVWLSDRVKTYPVRKSISYMAGIYLAGLTVVTGSFIWSPLKREISLSS